MVASAVHGTAQDALSFPSSAAAVAYAALPVRCGEGADSSSHDEEDQFGEECGKRGRGRGRRRRRPAEAVRASDPIDSESEGKRLAADDFRSVTGRPWIPGVLDQSGILVRLSAVAAATVEFGYRIRSSRNYISRRDGCTLRLLPRRLHRADLVYNHIHVRPDMQVTALERALQGDGQRRVWRTTITSTAIAIDVDNIVYLSGC